MNSKSTASTLTPLVRVALDRYLQELGLPARIRAAAGLNHAPLRDLRIVATCA